jgi:hypothetical protein
MAYVPIDQVWKCGPWDTRALVTDAEYGEAMAKAIRNSMGRKLGPSKPPPLKIPSMFWEIAGFWFVVIGLYGLAYMTWGM